MKSIFENKFSLTRRASDVLCAVVELYLQNAVPVGAKAVADIGKLDLATSTLRAVMAELACHGYLEQPHTSAGRIPSDKGFYCYFRDIMTPVHLKIKEISTLKRATHGEKWSELASLLKNVSKALSHLSKQTSFVAISSPLSVEIKKIHLIHLQGNKSMAVIVGAGGAIENRFFETCALMNQQTLDKVTNYFANRFRGLGIGDIRQKLLMDTLAEKNRSDLLVNWAMEIADSLGANEELTLDSLCFDGSGYLMDTDRDIELVRKLFETIDEKGKALAIISDILKVGGTSLTMGRDSGIAELSPFSIVSHTFSGKGDSVGTVGIIGPRMMDYSYMAALVTASATQIGARLGGREDN